MLLSELLDADSLGLRVLHAAAQPLDRPLGRLITIDLLEPGRFLSGGEVVLTGLVWRRRAEDSARFVASVAERGAGVILAGRALLGEIPDDLLEACREHGVTLVEVPADVAFADITEYVAGSVVDGDRASASLVRQRQLLSAIASGQSLDELVARVAAEVRHDCRVLTATGRHVVPGPGPLRPAVVDAVVRRFLAADRLPATVDVPGDGSYSVFGVGPGLGNRLTSWFLVAEGDHREWPRDRVDAVHELSVMAALDRTRRDEGLRARQLVAGRVLALVESAAPYAEVAERLTEAGVAADQALTVVVADVEGPADVAATLLEDVALGFGPPLVARCRDGTPVALLPAQPGLVEHVRTAVARLEPGLARALGSGQGAIAVGLSAETTADALAGALEEARYAQRVAWAASSAVTVVAAEDVASHVVLLATVPDDVRRTYAHRVLGPVLEHDARTGGDLVATLAEFLACSGSWARTAEAMHLHVNTVRYRIDRVQELVGRDLSRLEDRVDVFLALKSL